MRVPATVRSLACLFALGLFFYACAAQTTPPSATATSGDKPAAEAHFLGADYAKLTPAAYKDFKNLLYWKAQGYEPKYYTAVLLEPTVVWQAEEQARKTGVKLEELHAVARHFDEVLKKTMEELEFPLAKVPGPRVLRASAAITEARPGNPTLNTITSVLPISLLVSLGTKAATGHDPNVGSCSIEMRFADAGTGNTVAMLADHREGDKYDRANAERFGQVHKAEEAWAAMLRERILALWGARK